MDPNASPNTATNIGCVCNSRYWGTSPLSTSSSCIPCYLECLSCSEANICLTCLDPNASPTASSGCTCNSGFWGTSPLSTSSSCSACYWECQSCTSANACSQCKDPNASPNTSTNTGCLCNAGYWGIAPLSTSTSCTLCYNECTTCSQALKCDQCVDPNALPDVSTGCKCIAGYWGNSPLTSSTSCASCYLECLTCTQAGQCSSCTDVNAVPNTTSNIGCVCQTGFWGSSPLSYNGACLPCYSECASCTEASICLSCVDSNASPDASTSIGCLCNAGFWSSGLLSTEGSCQACNADCSSCTQADVCSACVDPFASQNTITNIGCLCTAGYWGVSPLSTSTSCTLCYSECASCVQADLCTSCIDPNASPNTLPDIGCTCKQGFWGVGPLTTATSCISCFQECATCTQPNQCSTCIDPNASPNTATNLGCVCNGQYWGVAPLITATSCTACYIECLSCSENNICTTCIDPNASPDTSTNIGCLCNLGYSGVKPLSTATSCLTCYSECIICSAYTQCLTCVDPNASPNTISSYGCTCNSGYWGVSPLDTGASCTGCYDECSTCDQANICIDCIDPNASPNLVLGCTCNTGFWGTSPLTTSGSCAPCNFECATCAQSLACSTCIALNASPNPYTFIGCICNTGYWGIEPLLELYACTQCYEECATCSQAEKCDTCIDPNAVHNTQTSIGCVCSAGYWGVSPLLTTTSCMKCNIQCATCSDSDSCLTCASENASPNNVTGIGCVCNTGYYELTSVSCMECQKSCITCTDPNTCTACKMINSNPTTNGTCNCPETSENDNNTACYCQTGYAMHQDPNTLVYSCVSCNPSCSSCTGTGDDQCTYCAGVLSVNYTSNKCELCPKGMYFSNYDCYNCSFECSSCSSYDFCLSCSGPGKEANNLGQCNIACGPGKIFIDDWCYQCSDLCDVCSHLETCTICIDNASLTNQICSCNPGYTSSNKACVPYYFNATLQVVLVSNYNKLLLVFSEAPAPALILSDFQIAVPGSVPSVDFYMKDAQDYSFRLSFDTQILINTPVVLTILYSPLYSVSNSILSNYTLTANLFEYDPVKSNAAVKAMVSAAAGAAQAAVSISIGSAITSNPAAAWALINTIQVVTYLPINSNSLTPGLQAFCTGLGQFNLLPNPMTYAFNISDTSPPYTEATNYGINSSMFWVNMGQNISLFLALVAIWPFLFLLSKLKLGRIAMKFGNILENYRYGLFLRFWIQSYLDVGFYSLIQVKSVRVM